MHYFYIATVFSGAFVLLLASVLLILRRKSGERSRVILAIIVFYSVLNYLPRFFDLISGVEPEFVVSAKLLLLANFMVFSYIVYPLEVISPGWLNLLRFLKLFALWLLLLIVYFISSWAGVEYTPYSSLIEMVAHADRFEVWFRLLLAFLMFSPILFILYLYRTKLYHNSDRVWINKYIITFLLNIVAYILVVIFNNDLIHIVYYYVSVGCSLYIVYLELFDRLIGKPTIATPVEYKDNVEEEIIADDIKPASLNTKTVIEHRNSVLLKRLETYMKDNNAWRDPDLSLNTLASELYTNRTTLAQVLQDNGYENYTNYIKKLRIDDFMQQIESGKSMNFQEAFFYVGFRSRSTALRNFQQVTGISPSEYFQKKNILTEQ
ncbi:MAG: AraC family transcriptional regulator [Bacteroidia bacterium]|nr:AraC family transcriptional regulator [Bacteroidia bacterium]